MNTTSKQQKLFNKAKNTIKKLSKDISLKMAYTLLGMFLCVVIVTASIYLVYSAPVGESWPTLQVGVNVGDLLTIDKWNGLINKIDELEGQVAPPGAVMAFNLVACPDGWSEYTSAEDRTIIGSGSSYSLGATGGASTHTLTIAQMPSHTHSYVAMVGNNAIDGVDSVTTFSGEHHLITKTSGSTGSDQAHNNMQPYIALLYCVKD